MTKKVYVYPRLPGVYDFGFIRFRGYGLANCLFVLARAYLLSQRNGWELLNPTWQNLVIGPYLRGEKDKRHYIGLFNKIGISGMNKMFVLLTNNKVNLESAIKGYGGKIVVSGLANYFEDIIYDHVTIKNLIYKITKEEVLVHVLHADLSNCIGIHVRLGDYLGSRLKTRISWYTEMIEKLILKRGSNQRILLFSDGKDEELSELLSYGQVERSCFGSALSDMLALSKCKLIIGSDSTFSGWAAYLNQTPIIFPSCHFGRVLDDYRKELHWNERECLLDSFLNYNGF